MQLEPENQVLPDWAYSEEELTARDRDILIRCKEDGKEKYICWYMLKYNGKNTGKVMPLSVYHEDEGYRAIRNEFVELEPECIWKIKKKNADKWVKALYVMLDEYRYESEKYKLKMGSDKIFVWQDWYKCLR